MHINRLYLNNQKSFFGETEFSFEPGFNILLGGNSSGKTAVLEALDLSGGLAPHRSLLSNPTLSPIANTAEVVTGFSLRAAELQTLTSYSDDYVGNTHEDGSRVEMSNNQVLSSFLNEPLHFEVRRHSAVGEQLRLFLQDQPCAWQQRGSSPQHVCARIERDTPHSVVQQTSGDQSRRWDELRNIFASTT